MSTLLKRKHTVVLCYLTSTVVCIAIFDVGNSVSEQSIIPVLLMDLLSVSYNVEIILEVPASLY